MEMQGFFFAVYCSKSQDFYNVLNQIENFTSYDRCVTVWQRVMVDCGFFLSAQQLS